MAYPKTDEFFNQCLTSFSFDEQTGAFFETRTKGDHTWQEPAGIITTGGIRLTVKHTYVMAHHLIWRMTHGEWPNYLIKHVDKNNLNNHPDNLCAPARAKHEKKKKESQMIPFLLSLGYSDKQVKRYIVEMTRERFGESLALDTELKMKLITKNQHKKKRQELEEEFKLPAYGKRQTQSDEVKPLKMYTAESDNQPIG